MWIRIKERLVNLDKATDIGIKDDKVTIYFGQNDYWSTEFDGIIEAEEVFEQITRELESLIIKTDW